MEENRFVAPENQEAAEESIRDSGARPESGNAEDSGDAPERTEGRGPDQATPEDRPREDVADPGLPPAPALEADLTESEALPEGEAAESAPEVAEAVIDPGLPTAPMPEASESESESSEESAEAVVDTGLPTAPVVEAGSTEAEQADALAAEAAPESGPAEALPEAEAAADAADPGLPTPVPEASESESEPSEESAEAVVETGLPTAPVVEAGSTEPEALPEGAAVADAVDPGLPTAPMPEASESESEPFEESAEAVVYTGLPTAPVVEAGSIEPESLPEAEAAADAADPDLPAAPMPEASESESELSEASAEAVVDTGLPTAPVVEAGSTEPEALAEGKAAESAPEAADAVIDPGLPTASAEAVVDTGLPTAPVVEGDSTEPETDDAAIDTGLPTASMVEGNTTEPAPAEAEAVDPDQATGPALEALESSHPQPDVAGDGAMTADELLGQPAAEEPATDPTLQLRAVIEAIIYVTEEPLTKEQIAAALQQPLDLVKQVLAELSASFDKPEHGIGIREVAGGYKMATKAEHHDAVRNFVRNLKPPLKLSLAALETLAVIAYKQPVTAPEIAEIRGVQGTGVMKTLLDRKLIAAAGRKNVIGKPILYKTTKDFLVQFGLKDLSELPSLKEFEEIRRMALTDEPAAEPLPAEAATGRQPAGDPPQEEPPVEPPPSEEPPVEPPPSEEPPVEPPPSEDPPVTEPPPSEEPKQSDGE